MRKQGKILTGIIGVLCLVAGFFIGVLVSFPPVDEAKLAGTIGKINNYRNVKITENDLQLRNELLNDRELALQYNKYLSFHYLNSAQLTELLIEASNTARLTPDFSDAYSAEILSLMKFENYLDEARKDILIAITALQRLSENPQESIGLLLNNANNAITQINFRGQAVIEFVEALDTFFAGNDPDKYPDLKKAHDLLLINQVRTAMASQDKIKIRYLDKKEFLNSKDELRLLSGFNPESFNLFVQNDFAAISDKAISDKVLTDKNFSDKVLTDRNFSDKVLNDKAINDKVLTDKVFSDKVLNDKNFRDKVLNDKAFSDKVLTDKVFSDKVLTDKVFSDKVLTDKVFSDKILTDKVFSDKVFSDKVFSDKIFSDKVFSDKVLNDKAFSDKILTDKVFSDKVLTDKVFSDKVLTDKVFSDMTLNSKQNLPDFDSNFFNDIEQAFSSVLLTDMASDKLELINDVSQLNNQVLQDMFSSQEHLNRFSPF